MTSVARLRETLDEYKSVVAELEAVAFLYHTTLQRIIDARVPWKKNNLAEAALREAERMGYDP